MHYTAKVAALHFSRIAAISSSASRECTIMGNSISRAAAICAESCLADQVAHNHKNNQDRPHQSQRILGGQLPL